MTPKTTMFRIGLSYHSISCILHRNPQRRGIRRRASSARVMRGTLGTRRHGYTRYSCLHVVGPTARRCALMCGIFSKAVIRDKETDTRSALMLDDGIDPRGEETHIPSRCDFNVLLRD